MEAGRKAGAGRTRVRFRFLRRPGRGLLAGVAGLYRAAGWWYPGDTPRLLARLVAGSQCFLVALDSGKPVGMARALGDGASDAYVQDVFVAVTHRGRGIASELVARVSRRLKAGGLRWIGLVSTGGGRRLYRRLGFRPLAGHRPMRLS